MSKFVGLNGPVWLNLTEKVYYGDAKRKIVDKAITTLFEQQDGSLTALTEHAVELLISSDVCLPYSFFLSQKGASLNWRIPAAFIRGSVLGYDILEELSDYGLTVSDDIDPSSDRKNIGTRLRCRVLASLVMATLGTDDFRSIPINAHRAFVSRLRTPDGLRFREDLLRDAESFRQAASGIIKSIAMYHGDEKLFDSSKNKRLTVGNSRTWKAILSNPDPLELDLIQNYKEYSSGSIDTIALDRKLIMDLTSILRKEGLNSMQEALAEGISQGGILTFYRERKGILPKTIATLLSQIERFSKAVIERLAERNPDVTFRSLVSAEDYSNANRELGDRKTKPSSARAYFPERYAPLAKEVLDEGEEGWPGRIGLFNVTVLHKGKTREIYCPVIPTLIRSAFDLPLRISQFLRLDSGEGDLKRFNAETMRWESNSLPTAGFWKRTTGEIKTRGYAFEFEGTDPKITGFNINSNKTGKPYQISWQHEALHRRLFRLAEWQIKYNPLENSLTPQEYYKATDDRLQASVASLPDIFPLFGQVPWDLLGKARVPPSWNQIQTAWGRVMQEVQRRWNLANPDDLVELVKIGPNGQIRAIHGIHGLRARGISDLYAAGVPLEILSEIVAGHATVAMTIYYLDRDPAKIHAALERAAIETQSLAAKSFQRELRKANIDDARRRSTTMYSESFAEAFVDRSNRQFCNVDIGICVYDGERCNDGYKVSEDGEVDRYGAVPGGSRNCILCRHFVSGTPFILPMEIFGCLQLWKRNELSAKLAATDEKVSELLRRKETSSISKEQYSNEADRLRLNRQELHDEIKLRDSMIFNTKFHLETAVKILEENEKLGRGNQVAFVGNSSDAVVRYTQRSQFELANIISTASRFWSILDDPLIEHYKKNTIDQIMFHGGELPLSLRANLTDKQRSVAADLLGQYFLARVPRQELGPLAQNKMRLQDLNLEKEVSKLIENSLRSAIDLGPTLAKSALFQLAEANR